MEFSAPFSAPEDGTEALPYDARHFGVSVMMRLPLALGVSLFAALASAQEPAPAVSAWKPLFDGKTTAGWRGFKKEAFPEKGWMVEDSCLHIRAGGGAGDIVTVDEYQDFELRFEWKVAAGANSGVFFRVGEEDDAPWYTGPEYQILDDAKHADGQNPKTSAAAAYGMYKAVGKELAEVGAFNEGRIVVVGSRVEHWLNGTRVLAYELGSETWKTDIAASKFASMPNFGRRPKGRIALQDHGDDVWFRNLRIREFDPSKVVTLYDGKSLAEWTWFLPEQGKFEGTWSVDDEGVLVCKGQPAGYIRTTRDFTNFLLTLEWRFSPITKQAGNSGVLVRMVGQDKVWPRSVEAQLMSGSAGDFWNIDDFPMRTDPARTKGRNTKRLATNEHPLGEWNRYEVEVDRSHVELRVNGKVLNEAFEVAEWPGKICLQSEGAEIHFRDIRLYPIAGGSEKSPMPEREIPKPVWSSGVLRGGQSVRFDVDVEGAASLWLVAEPTEDGEGCDWADWGEMWLEDGDRQRTDLTSLTWASASTGWGEVRINQSCDGGELALPDRPLRSGIGTHAPSIIRYSLSGKGFRRLGGVVGIDRGGAKQGNRASVEFKIFTKNPWGSRR